MTTTSHEELRHRALALGLCGLVANWDQLDPGLLEHLATFIELEEEERQRRGLERRLRAAHLGAFKPIADFDWSWPSRCDRDAIEQVMKLRFLDEGANALLIGPNGVGKTTIAKNIAYQALILGRTVIFVTASKMLNDLAVRDSASALESRLKHYSRTRLLCIDELGYLSYGNRHADLLFEVIRRRYEMGRSILVTTNKPFALWSDIFPNAACVVTLVDRLVHRSDLIQIEAKSYRLKEAKERNERRSRSQSKRNKGPGKL